MDPLSFLARMLDVSARIGAALVLVALLCAVGQYNRWDFFTRLDPTIYQTVIIAGLIGAALLFIDLIRLLARSMNRAFTSNRAYREQKKAAKNNMKSLSRPHALVLRYLKKNDIARFRAENSYGLLTDMCQSGLIVRDDPSHTVFAKFTYYKVPSYIWRLIDSNTPTDGIPRHIPAINP